MIQKAILNLTIVRGATFGPVEIIAKNDAGQIVPLAGWQAFAHARKSATSPVAINLAPVIVPNDTVGLITIPEISWEMTKTYDFQTLEWDLMLQTPQGKRLVPRLGGTIQIVNASTQPQ
jgi:hypothetical protein